MSKCALVLCLIFSAGAQAEPTDATQGVTLFRGTLLTEPELFSNNKLEPWGLNVRVDKIEAGPAPFTVGAEPVFQVHSPSLLFNGKPKALSHYRFRVEWVRRGKMIEFVRIEVLP